MEKAQIDELLISFGWNYNQAEKSLMYISLKNIRVNQEELIVKLASSFDKKPPAPTLTNKIWYIVTETKEKETGDCSFCENRRRITVASIPYLESLVNTEKMATIKPIPHGQLLSTISCPKCSGLRDLEMYYGRYINCGDYDRYVIEYVWNWFRGSYAKMEEILTPSGRLMNNG